MITVDAMNHKRPKCRIMSNIQIEHAEPARVRAHTGDSVVPKLEEVVADSRPKAEEDALLSKILAGAHIDVSVWNRSWRRARLDDLWSGLRP